MSDSLTHLRSKSTFMSPLHKASFFNGKVHVPLFSPIHKHTSTKHAKRPISTSFRTTKKLRPYSLPSRSITHAAHRPKMSTQDVNTFAAEKTIDVKPELFTYLDKYGRKHFEQVDALRSSSLEKRSHCINLMLEPTTCSLLEHQLRQLQGLRVLEVGVFTGVTTLALSLNILQNYQQKTNTPLKHNVLAGIAASLSPEVASNIRKVAKFDESHVITDSDVMLYDSATTLQYVTNFLKKNTSETIPLAFGIDIDHTTIRDVALPHFEQTGVVGAPLVFLSGNAHDIMTQLANDPLYQGTFDLIFIDADKGGYSHYYTESLRLLRKGGIVALDNVLWKGRVAQFLDPKAIEDANAGIYPITQATGKKDPQAWSLHEVNELIYNDPRTDSITLPIGDGLTLARLL